MKHKVDAEQVWEVAWTYIKTVVDTVREPFLILDEDLKILSANKTFYSNFLVKEEETIGKKVYDLGNGQWNISKLRILLEDILPKNTFFEDFKVEHDFPRIGRKIMILNARRVHVEGEKRPIMLLAMEDITKQKQLEEQLKDYAKNLAHEVAKRTIKLESRILDLERNNKIMMSRETKISELEKEIEQLKKKIISS